MTVFHGSYMEVEKPDIALSRENIELRKKFLVKEFASYSDEWLDYIIACRSGRCPGQYDVVIGGVANDKVFDTIELYFSGSEVLK